MTLRMGMWVGAGIALVLILAAIYLEGRARGVAIEKRNTDAALSAAANANAEPEVARQAAVRIDEMSRRTARTMQITREHAISALEAQDANTSLPGDRTARLLDADRRLCELNSRLEGCAGIIPDP